MGFLITAYSPHRLAAAPIRVVVWDEREAAQLTAYPDYLGNTLAAFLAKPPRLTVSSTGLNEADPGLSDEVLDNCDVLIWWGHEKHSDVTPEHVMKAVADRIKGRAGFRSQSRCIPRIGQHT